MKKLFILVSVFFIAVSMVCAQNQAPRTTVTSLDNSTRLLASELNKRLATEKVEKVAIGEFVYGGIIPPFSQYLVNQLCVELTNQRGSFSILQNVSSDADWVISGEIVELADMIRVYTKLIRSSDRVVRVAFHADFERNEYMVQMLLTSDGRSSYVPMDALEPDSWDNSVSYEIGTDENSQPLNRTLHNGDEDFFLLVPVTSGRHVMETIGSTDTYMELYNAENKELLSQNDDGGTGGNAKILHNMEAGKRYLVKIRPYSSGETGQYGFRSFFLPQVIIQPDEYEQDDSPSSAKMIDIGSSQQHTFHSENDVDWVKFQVTDRGRYTIRARGGNSSSRPDTYIELYDSDMDSIGEDDDGGENLDSKLSLNLNTGLYYLKIRCVDDEIEQPYILSIERE